MKNRINYSQLSGSVLLAFVRALVALFAPEKVSDALLTRLLGKVNAILSDLLKGFEFESKDPLTVEAVEKDLLRDNYWNGLKNYVKAFLFNPDAQKAAAAEKLMAVIRKYGWSANEYTFDQETSAVTGLLDEVAQKYAAEVALLQLQALWLTPLKDAQLQFEAIQTRRIENGAVDVPTISKYRKSIIAAVKKLIDTLETVAEDSNNAALQQLVLEVDELIGRTMSNLKAAATRNENEGANVPLK